MYTDENKLEQNLRNIDALQELSQTINRMMNGEGVYEQVSNVSVSFTQQGARATVTTKKSLFISSR